jgi:hypothetical protein
MADEIALNVDENLKSHETEIQKQLDLIKTREK